MALDLVARLTLRDDFSRRFNSITRSMGNLGRSVNEQSKQLTGMRTQIMGLAAGYLSAQGAAKAFHATIGAAAKHEASEVAISAIFNDKGLSDSYLKMVDKMALDSPLLNSKEMLSSSKGIIAMTKDMDDLGKTWSIIEKLQVLDPTQGTDGAAFAMKEMFQGDALSMVERFGLNKKELNRIKKLSIPQQLAEIDSLLNGMGVTEEAINKMGQTTVGLWSQIGERTEKFMRSIGSMGNSKIGEVLGDILAKFETMDLDAIAVKVDAAIGGAIQKVVDFTKKVWEWREPILAAAKAVGTFVGVVAGIVAFMSSLRMVAGLIGFLLSPIGLLAFAIIGIGAAFKAAYANSEPFRKAIDGIVGAVKGLFVAFTGGDADKSMDIFKKAGLDESQIAKVIGFGKSLKGAFDQVKIVFAGFGTLFSGGGSTNLLEALGFSPAAITSIQTFVEMVKTKIGEFATFLASKWEAIKPGIMSLLTAFMGLKDTAISIFTTLWGVLSPIFSAVMNALTIVADIAVMVFKNIIVPAVLYVISVFQMWWKIIGPILSLIGSAIGVAFGILKIAWDTIIAPFANFLTTIFKKALESLTPLIEGVGGMFDWLGGIIETIAGWFDTFTSALSKFKVPNWLSKLGGGGTVKFESTETVGKKVNGSHFHGIDRIPTDNYLARLHKGERILTRQESDAMDSFGYSPQSGSTTYNQQTYNSQASGGESQAASSGPSFSIAKLADQIIVREDTDIDKIAEQLLIKLRRAEHGGGY